MIRINQLKMHPGHSFEELQEKVCKFLRISIDQIDEIKIHKQSIDARKKPEIYFSYSVDVKTKQEEQIKRRLKNKVQIVNEISYIAPSKNSKGRKSSKRPIIVGSGPAGLFCAYLLAKAGCRPILLERGGSVEERAADVERFWNTGKLNLSSNVQFGEGGAGTFSDGKLNTLVKDVLGRNHFVLETFVKFGAPESILYENKPHIGTDVLIDVVKNMRNEILNLGGEVRFHSQMTDVEIKDAGEDKEIAGITINQEEKIVTDLLVLAIGHSARDTFRLLYDNQFSMRSKPFAVGVRIEHPQKMINQCQYGMEEPDCLPTAAYKLTTQLSNGRGAYTFCMCPGGYVVNASSEEKRLAVNGMSYQKRDGENANSAVIVTVSPEDFGGDHPLSGVEFQRLLEEKAYQAGDGMVPVQCFGDFRENKATTKLGEVEPQMKGAYRLSNVRAIFPEFLSESIEEGILAMGKKIHGFSRNDAVLSAVESRTSSPVKIQRDEAFESNIKGVYPCGEGAGYAGGITSAAMDGMKVAEAILKNWNIEIAQEFTEN